MNKSASKTNIFYKLIAIFSILSILAVCCWLYDGHGMEKITTAYNGNNLIVHFLDVGQADSILIQLPGSKCMLIDAGNDSDSDYIINYLDKLNIGCIDYLIATHPHEDHIGGMDEIIEKYDIGRFLVPDLPDTYTNTKYYQAVLDAAEVKNIIPTSVSSSSGNIIDDGETIVTVIAPYYRALYSDLNNCSVCLRLQYYQTVMLFMGDASQESEADILDYTGINLKADILKIGHHGSKESSSQSFLKKVQPATAVISCGKNNKYGHPHSETLERLKTIGATVYRTDNIGTIVITCDNSGYSVAGYGE